MKTVKFEFFLLWGERLACFDCRKFVKTGDHAYITQKIEDIKSNTTTTIRCGNCEIKHMRRNHENYLEV